MGSVTPSPGNRLDKVYDVIIVGGGPAGLSAGLGLSRKIFSVLVFDDGNYRNAATTHMHNFPGFDHSSPEDFRSTVRNQIQQRYPLTEFRDRKVVNAWKAVDDTDADNPLFRLQDENGQQYTCRKLVLATGVRDIMPPSIKGYDTLWGRYIFHCLFCHGYEERNAERAGVLAGEGSMLTNKDVALATAKTTKRFANQVTIFTHGNEAYATALIEAGAEAQGFTVCSRRIQALATTKNPSGDASSVHGGELLVKFQPDPEHPVARESVSLGFLVHAPDVELPNPWTDMLGLEVTDQQTYHTTGIDNETNVKGVFLAGDHATPARAVATAVTTGAFTAGAVAHQLIMQS